MKFAHMADLHLGGWRDPELEQMNLEAFEQAVDRCISEKVDFIIISGDFFDVSMPPFDILDFASKKLSEVIQAGIPVYTISGSHDFSPSGKTILKVFENSGLMINVAKGEEKDDKLLLNFTEDKKTGAKLTGIYGRKGSLEEEYFRKLDRSIEQEPGYKIFLFHSGIEEYKPKFLKDVPAMPLSLLPKNFDYYAAGHIHHRCEHAHEKGNVVFPGPLFPCNFPELERYGSGGFYIVEEGKPEFVELKQAEVFVVKVDAENKAAKDVEAELDKKISKLSGDDFILLIRVSGTMSEGNSTDIKFRRLYEEAYEAGARAVKRNTNSLSSKEYEEVRVSMDSIDNLESKLIEEHIGQSEIPDAKKLVNRLMRSLDTEKLEGETNPAFESRVVDEAEKVFK
jgi:hypothetical protein